MSERQTVQRWMITVGGVEQARVGAGQSVEIGRKPIRPLREDGFTRIDIVDNKRSMSKRHALLIVDTRGVATIRDLHSTNGTYLVGANGDLLRLEPDVDFQLPDNLMRMQFGDVPIDFVRVEDEVADNEHEVRNLFSYATDDTHEEPAAGDLSVDQILDLRAGEPTGIFQAQSVSHPGLSWQQGAALQPLSSEISHNNHNVALPVVREQQEEPVEPRNLFADAQAIHSQIAQESSYQEGGIQDGSVNSDENSDENSAETNVENNAVQMEAACEAQTNTEQEANQLEQSVTETAHAKTNHTLLSQFDTVDEATTGPFATDVIKSSIAAINNAETNTAANTNHYESADYLNSTSATADSKTADSATYIATDSEDSYTPAFEPGSVFEKVSKGEFDAQQNMVEVGGFTSQDAREITDFSRQFEMAQYAELLPYLAENPGLYDDLYAWLAAQGNAQVDAALACNSGYSAYREAIEQ